MAEFLGCRSPAFASVLRTINQVADTSATVLLLGETGTGKEFVARQIHLQSPRSNGPFIAANCGGVPLSLAASELFGHESGAFTGAVRRRTGLFESAHGGTLFLDEVGELPSELQPLLLRVIEDKTVERLGGSPFLVDARQIAATNRDLSGEVQSGRFRADLYYRLNVFPITLPPLRDRREDIPELAHHFLHKFARAHSRPAATIPSLVLQHLMRYDWPGNVRELRNVIERGVIISQSSDLEIDPAWLAGGIPTVPSGSGRTWAAQEKARILEALRATSGRIYGPGGAAHRLGLRPTTLYGKMRKHGITRNLADWE